MSLLFILLVFHSKYSQKSYLFIEVKLLKEKKNIMRDEVGEHMAQDLRPFLHAVSLQILQILRSTFVDSASAHPTDFLWGLGRGTVMAMAKPLFCGR